jgi:bacteriocin-like protein
MIMTTQSETFEGTRAITEDELANVSGGVTYLSEKGFRFDLFGLDFGYLTINNGNSYLVWHSADDPGQVVSK